MAFVPPAPSEPPAPRPPNAAYPNDEPLLRLGGLYPSKTGNALTGNISLTYSPRETQEPVGVSLGDLIQRAMEADRPLRFLVFENTRTGHPPYILNVTLGNPRAEAPPTGPGPDAAPPGDDQPPEAPPRPPRRAAPRRF